MLQRILKKWLRRLRKSRGLKKAIKVRGGNVHRDAERAFRQQEILRQKRTIVKLMVVSWRLKEIKPPTPEEYRSFFYNYPMTWKYILEVQKKYWRENI
jgi:hypothetical protein